MLQLPRARVGLGPVERAHTHTGRTRSVAHTAMSDAHFNAIHREPPGALRHGNPMVALAPLLLTDREFTFPPKFLDPHRAERERTEHAQAAARLGFDPALSLWRPHLEHDGERIHHSRLPLRLFVCSV